MFKDDASPLPHALGAQLRRGTVTIAVLAKLDVEHHCGGLNRALARDGLEVGMEVLYPMLRRLEDQGLLVSEQRDDNRRSKRFYRVSGQGAEVLVRLKHEWRALSDTLSGLVLGAEASDPPSAGSTRSCPSAGSWTR